MKNRLTITVLLSIMVVGIPLIYLYYAQLAPVQVNDQADAESRTVASKSPEATSEPEQVADSTKKAPSKGAYVEYSEDKLANALGTKVIFFHAPWCPQCRALEADIQKVGVPDGVTIFKADYDTNTELRQKYGVTLQTTLVKVDNKGKLIAKYVAYNEPTLESVENNLLNK